VLGFRHAGGSRNPSIVFSAVEVYSRSSILSVYSTAAAVAQPVDIDAMIGGDNDDDATAGAAAPAAVSAAAVAAEVEED
jgi:hypothetical protein